MKLLLRSFPSCQLRLPGIRCLGSRRGESQAQGESLPNSTGILNRLSAAELKPMCFLAELLRSEISPGQRVQNLDFLTLVTFLDAKCWGPERNIACYAKVCPFLGTICQTRQSNLTNPINFAMVLPQEILNCLAQRSSSYFLTPRRRFSCDGKSLDPSVNALELHLVAIPHWTGGVWSFNDSSKW